MADHKLDIVRGDDDPPLTLALTQTDENGDVVPVFLDGAVFKMEIRGAGVHFDLSSADGGLLVDDEAGTVSWPYNEGQSLRFPHGRAATFKLWREVATNTRTFATGTITGRDGPTGNVSSVVYLPGPPGARGPGLSKTVELTDFLDPGGIVVNSNARIDAWRAHMAANPGTTYRGRKGDVYAVDYGGGAGFYDVRIPSTCRLMMEGGRFMWTGGIVNQGFSLLQLNPGAEFDALIFHIPSGSTIRRVVDLAGSNIGSLVHIYADVQQSNDAGSNLDAAIRLRGGPTGPGHRLGELRTDYVDFPFLLYSADNAANATVGTRVDLLTAYNYVRGIRARNIKDTKIGFSHIWGRSPNTDDDPGRNALLTEGVHDFWLMGYQFEDAGEHAWRVGGRQNETQLDTRGVHIYHGTSRRSGECGGKVFWGGATVYDVDLMDLTAEDCGIHNDNPAFNRMGFMLQDITRGRAMGLRVCKRDTDFAGFDSFYFSGLQQFVAQGLEGYGAVRNVLRITEFGGNEDGSEEQQFPKPTRDLTVDGLKGGGHGAEGVCVVHPSQEIRDVSVRGRIVGGTKGLYWPSADAAQAAGVNEFDLAITGQSGADIDVPVSAAIKAVNRLAA